MLLCLSLKINKCQSNYLEDNSSWFPSCSQSLLLCALFLPHHLVVWSQSIGSSYTHTGGLEVTQVIMTATKRHTSKWTGCCKWQPDWPLSDIPQHQHLHSRVPVYLCVTAYNKIGSSSAQCEPVRHQIGTLWPHKILHVSFMDCMVSAFVASFCLQK